MLHIIGSIIFLIAAAVCWFIPRTAPEDESGDSAN